MTTEQVPRPLASLAGVLLFLLVAGAATIAIHAGMMPYRSGGGMFLGWLLCIAAFAVTAAVVAKVTGGGGGLFVPFLLFCIFSCLYGVVGGRLPRLLSLRETPVIPVKEADRPPHDAADVFHFSDGHVDGRYHTYTIHRRKTGAFAYHVAPILPEGWKESDPITAWAVGEQPDGTSAMPWSRDARGGYRSTSVAEFDNLIRDEVARHHLATSPTAPLIFWDDHPRESLLKAARIELWVLIGVNLLSLAALLYPLLRNKRAAA